MISTSSTEVFEGNGLHVKIEVEASDSRVSALIMKEPNTIARDPGLQLCRIAEGDSPRAGDEWRTEKIRARRRGVEINDDDDRPHALRNDAEQENAQQGQGRLFIFERFMTTTST